MEEVETRGSSPHSERIVVHNSPTSGDRSPPASHQPPQSVSSPMFPENLSRRPTSPTISVTHNPYDANEQAADLTQATARSTEALAAKSRSPKPKSPQSEVYKQPVTLSSQQSSIVSNVITRTSVSSATSENSLCNTGNVIQRPYVIAQAPESSSGQKAMHVIQETRRSPDPNSNHKIPVSMETNMERSSPSQVPPSAVTVTINSSGQPSTSPPATGSSVGQLTYSFVTNSPNNQNYVMTSEDGSYVVINSSDQKDFLEVEPWHQTHSVRTHTPPDGTRLVIAFSQNFSLTYSKDSSVISYTLLKSIKVCDKWCLTVRAVFK